MLIPLDYRRETLVERLAEQRSKTLLLMYGVTFVCLNAVSILLGKSHPNAASYPFLILAPALSCAACLYCAVTASSHARTGWLLFAIALFLWTAGISLSCWEDAAEHVPQAVAWFSDFSYFLYGVPLLLILSLPATAERVILFLWLDAIQVTFTACLIYVDLFGALPFLHLQLRPVPSTLLVSTYNAENILLAAFATLRLLTLSDRGAVRSRYALLTAFLWTYAVFAGVYNILYARIVLSAQKPMGLLDVLVPLPFVLLTIAILAPRNNHAASVPAREGTPMEVFLDSANPILYTLTLLALGIFTLRNHFRLGVLSIVIALCIYVIRAAVIQIRYLTAQRDLSRARDSLETLSQQDPLTGIPNRRCFEQTFNHEWDRAYRAQAPLSLLFIDVDHFKSINDRYGHPYGDTVLRAIATAIQSSLPRSGDLVARYGGEEFVIILPASGREASAVIGTRILEAIRNLHLPEGPVTVSVGAATSQPHLAGSKDLLVAAADQALYLAKHHGRNRLELADI